MPELPEVETTVRGLRANILDRKVTSVTVRQPRLRWPVKNNIKTNIIGRNFLNINRRGKYILLGNENGALIIHLGMSGSLRIIKDNKIYEKHDHIDISFINGTSLRYRDPRRFGSFHWSVDPENHFLLKNLGPEPLGNKFNGEYLYRLSRGKNVTIKNFIMNAKVVVGVGNIYANEALFLSNIRPSIRAKRLTKKRYEDLVVCIVKVLRDSINKGGTTLKDFVNGNNQPGYFKQQLNVYGRLEEPCKKCGTLIKLLRISQRSSYFCPKCQI